MLMVTIAASLSCPGWYERKTVKPSVEMLAKEVEEVEGEDERKGKVKVEVVKLGVEVIVTGKGKVI